MSTEKLDTSNLEPQQVGSQLSFQIRPHLADKFRPQAVKEVVQTVLSENLSGKVYANEDVSALCKELSAIIRTRVTEMDFSRYKIMVQVVIGEQHGAGVKMGARCMWDSDADSYTSAEFENDTLFCIAVVFAVFCY